MATFLTLLEQVPNELGSVISMLQRMHMLPQLFQRRLPLLELAETFPRAAFLVPVQGWPPRHLSIIR